MTKNEAIAAAMRQLAIEYSCEPDAFACDENIITISATNEGRRIYRPGASFLSFVCFGRGAVVTADKRIHGWLRDYLRDGNEPIAGYWLYERVHRQAIDAECGKYGKTLEDTFHMYLPDARVSARAVDIPVKWFEEDEIIPFYGAEQKLFPNSLSPFPNTYRPDKLAVAAYDGDKIIAMSGASADTPDMWQIGIEVLPEYRSRGIAAHLVSLLKNEILRRGKLPFYGTSLSNLGSQNVARAAGFFPAWIECCTIEPRFEPPEGFQV